MVFSREKRLPHLLLTLVLLLNAAALWPELTISRVDLNDNVLHFSLIERMAQAVQQGENPIDFWAPEWALGYPVLRTYQPLAHGLVVLVFFLIGKSVSLMTLFVWVRFLSVALLPLSFFGAARLMDLDRWTALAAAALAPLVSTNFLFGIDYGSYVWAGSGLFTQAVAVHFLLLTMGMAFQAVRQGRRQALTGALLGLTFLAHLIFGYIGALTVCLLAVMPDSEPRAHRLARTVRIGGVALLLSLFQLVPLLLDRGYINHSRWEPVWKWNSFGPGQVLGWLITGKLLDYGRLPVMSLLALGGIALWCWNTRRGTRSPALTFAVYGAALWTAIFCGRDLWGPLLSAIGISQDTHLHRVIGAVQIFLVLLAGIALAAALQYLSRRRKYAAAVGLTAILLIPMLRDRGQFLANNSAWGRRNLAAYEAAKAPLDATLAAVAARGGRAYAGLAATWGGSFKTGDVPLYAFFSTHRIPAVAYLYHSMALPGDLMLRFNDWNPVHYRLFNVRTVVWPADSRAAIPAFLTPSGQNGPFRVFEAPGAGYFEMVDVAGAVRAARSSFYDINERWLNSEGPALRQHLLLDWRDGASTGLVRFAPEQPLPRFSALPSAGAVKREWQEGQVYRAEAQTDRPAYLLFRMTWHPNWTVLVDGVKRETVMLSPGFTGVALQPGTHHVVCRYAPEWWKTPLAILGLLFTLALIAVEAGWIPGLPAIRWRIPLQLSPDTRRRCLIAAGLIALSLPVCIPLFTSDVLQGHDALTYLPRLVEVHQNVIHGILLPRWAPDFGRGSGQPLFLFHPPFFYWIAEFWFLLGCSPVTAINLACVLLAVAAAAAMFLLARFLFGDLGGWLGAAAYLYAPYFAVDLFTRAALEEFAAFPLYPLALFGFGAYAQRRQPRYLLLGSLAYTLILFTHFPAAMLFSPLLVGFLLFSAWMAGSWTILRNQAVAVLLGIGIAACVWIPAVAERGDVALDRVVKDYFRYSNHFVYLHQLLFSPWGYGFSVPGANDGMSFAIGWGHLAVLMVAWILVARRGKAAERLMLRFFAAAGAIFCFLVLPDAVWLWDHLPLLHYVQFPWRLLASASVCVAVMAAAAGPALSAMRFGRTAAVVAVFAVLIVPNLSHLAPRGFQTVDLALWTPQELARSGFEPTTSGEFTPRWIQALPRYDPAAAEWINGAGEIREISRTPFSWSADVAIRPSRTLRMSTAWYPGWHVRIDGRSEAAGPDPATGLIAFTVPEGRHRVSVDWESTELRTAASALSLISLVLLIVAARQWSKPPRPAATPPAAPAWDPPTPPAAPADTPPPPPLQST